MSDQSVAIQLPNNLFAGKTAIVTGASRGVGRATALRLAEGGANVVVNYISNHREAQETVDLCLGKGVEAIAVCADVSEFVGAQEIAKQAMDKFGQIDLLVCNAGVWDGAAIEDMSEELWNKVINTNLKSAWAMTKACVPAMKKCESAAIVMVSSTAGQRGEANYSNYAASKGGQISFTKALASELCPKIRVNAVAPGWIETAMVRPAFDDEEYKRSVIKSIPLQRIATTDDIALSICFLLSDWSRHITGEILNINGGAVLCG
ncbi:MAG TPA: 3-oxoacyl-ACP reductase family protein [Pyrinomonadaceae bacterium]|jgi:3-oxoacyl-[acyl-carrier protein] reductase|nr:3-oxoacyl-ACP reductase FabG [Chloracidobacterium sp.]MBP9934858.1 3-oxoacyl-ACP reductase FabG [Pyrinomonadaceae bacterium]MBK9768783.1 3-oxoacyl-ACP reductase FabG [Chloracidobacterium sp.]MBL0241059.1 3-oxoacyl-ACP reductase FabG [Chloracidobacterium sp.]HQX55466.1 3-oxoacyl-ACP reductase family protein [Pyrinomonadaceae bacterium]